MAAPRPIIHGRDHAPGGADPIPGWPTGDGGGGTGIQFDISNEGNWLHVETSDADAAGGSPFGTGIAFFDESGAGIGINASSGGDLELRTVGGGELRLRSTGGIELSEENDNTIWLHTTGSSILQGNDSAQVIAADSGTPGVALLACSTNSAGGGMYVRCEDNILTIHVASGIDALTAGAALLQIDYDGVDWNYHILTGASWVADL